MICCCFRREEELPPARGGRVPLLRRERHSEPFESRAARAREVATQGVRALRDEPPAEIQSLLGGSSLLPSRRRRRLDVRAWDRGVSLSFDKPCERARGTLPLSILEHVPPRVALRRLRRDNAERGERGAARRRKRAAVRRSHRTALAREPRGEWHAWILHIFRCG